MTRSKSYFSGIAAMLLFIGCASDPATHMAKHGIKTVAVEQRVDAPTLRYGEKRGGSLQAALTELTVDLVYTRRVKQITTVMQEHKIDVPAMVRSNFVTAINDLGYGIAETQPDATFIVELNQYGLEEKIFTSKIPFVVLDAELVKADGSVIWRGRSDGRKIDDPSLMGVKEWDEYERDPERLRNDWNAVVRSGVANL
ncbi:MAG TPA: hypothetical protein VM735_10960, partial [Candidatus Kapabacteria bacterium]|nr:hypothetical protein [Candidatus Kapabacteria bacterium]